ncbi:MAG: hypothetical protein R3D25_19325 [Geminicoccaceae bacterium]
MATQSDVERVMILEPSGEVRFASSEADLGRVLDLAGGALCPGCALAPGETRAMTAVVQSADGDEMIRSVQPVRNREPARAATDRSPPTRSAASWSWTIWPAGCRGRCCGPGS